MVTQTIKIDLTKDIITDHIIFKQGEIGREIEFEVYNEGVAVDLDGYDVTFSVYKPDGNFVIVSGTVDNDTVTIEETEQMTAVCGSGCFDLTLTKTNEVIYTFKGFIDIATPIFARETVNSVSMVFGLVFPDDFQEKLMAGENITIVDNVISASGGGGSYTAGDYISILNNVIDVKSSLISVINGKADASALNAKQDKLTAGTYIDIDASNNIDVKSSLISTINGKADASALAGKQDTLTAGTGITITNNVISASGGGLSIDVDHPDYTINFDGVNAGYEASTTLADVSNIDNGLYYMFATIQKTSGGFEHLSFSLLNTSGDVRYEPFARLYFAPSDWSSVTQQTMQGFFNKKSGINYQLIVMNSSTTNIVVNGGTIYLYKIS